MQVFLPIYRSLDGRTITRDLWPLSLHCVSPAGCIFSWLRRGFSEGSKVQSMNLELLAEALT